MSTNRKGNAFLYLTEKLKIEEIKKILEICTHLTLEYDLVENSRDYEMWRKSNASLEHSLFISNVDFSEEEFHELDKKLEDAVIILFGEHTNEKYHQKAEMKSRKLNNLLKKCVDFDGLLNYLTVLILPSKRFKMKVFGRDDISFDEFRKKNENLGNPQNITSNSSETKGRLNDNSEKIKEKITEKQNDINSTKLVDLSKTSSEYVEEEIENQSSVPIYPTADDEMDDNDISANLQFITEASKQSLPSAPAPQDIGISASKHKKEKTTAKNPIGILGENEKSFTKMEVPEQVLYEEVPYHIRAKKIQKKMASQGWEGHHTVGVWSPLHRMGVTSFVINFAIYLAENKVQTAVLEGLTEQHALKSWLERYTNVPNEWNSYAKALLVDDQSDEEWKWIYQNVMFLPLDKEDTKLKWDAYSLESYMTTTNIKEMTLVDLPTGKMTSYTEDSLHYLHELWIILDDSTQDILSWKEYIHAIKKRVNIPIYVVFNKGYEFSQVDRLCKELGLSLLTKIPALHEETMLNYYENKPLFLKREAREKLEPVYMEISKHLFGKEFQKNSRLSNKRKRNWSLNILKTLKGL